jgi:threonine aldolase
MIGKNIENKGNTMKNIDLRSDTVTLPTPAMREAMAHAPLGDDVYGDDPTINTLERRSAELFEKEAAIFVPSGTMGNLASILAHCQRGDEVIMGNKAHTFLYEAGGISALGGIHSCTIPNQDDGTLLLQDIENAIRPDDIHAPISRLLVLENTQNACGGTVLPPEYTHQAADLAHQHGLLVHIDGARIFNAAVAQQVPVSALTREADSVTFCLSKGLCCPAGSVIVGSQPFVELVRRVRKMLGGGMRQAGILAAAGLVALDEMIDRLADDHARARNLAKALGQISGIHILNDPPPTNMVYMRLDEAVALTDDELIAGCAAHGIIIRGRNGVFRLVTHYWINDDAVDKTVSVIKSLLAH